MATRRLIASLIAVAITIITTGCGGDGNLLPEPRQLPSGRTAGPLTPLPAFLVNNTTRCAFEENGRQVSLVEYRGVLENVTALNCEEAELENLDGIEALTALADLSLLTSGLTALDELAGNSTIINMTLTGNPLTDITALNSMAGVTNLYLSDTGTSDLTPLLDMNVRLLDLSYNPLADTDLSPLASLSLRRLIISHTDINDLDTIGSISSLTNLDISDNQISDITELSQLQKLNRIDLSNNDITDIDALLAVPNLRAVYLHGNEDLSCQSVFELQSKVGNRVVKTRPAACDNTLILTGNSPTERVIDNSTEELAYGRIFIRGQFETSDIELEKSGNDLIVRLAVRRTFKSVVFTDWYVDQDHQVAVFMLPDRSEYTYDQLVKIIPLTQVLTDNDDDFVGNSHRDIVYGLNGDDIIMGGLDEDILIGGEGDDILTPNAITLNGQGDVVDVAPSLQGNTYIYNPGDGNDTIYSNNSFAFPRGLLLFTDANAASQVELIRENDDLIFYFDDNNSVTINRWYAGASYRIRSLQFGDRDPIDAAAFVGSDGEGGEDDYIIIGTDGRDTLVGTPRDDIIMGGENADVLIGGLGDDILTPNMVTLDGDDNVIAVEPTRRKDTYEYYLGDGNDRIYSNVNYLGNRGLLKFGPNIEEDMITLIQENDDLVFYLDENNSVTVVGWFDKGRYRLGELEFDQQAAVDASQWVADRPLTLLTAGTLEGDNVNNILLGTDGNDVIRGEYGEDEIEGGLGDDLLAGNSMNIDGNGNINSVTPDGSLDTFIYLLGDGNDTIHEYETDDNARALLILGPGITATDTQASQSGSDLVLTFIDGGTVTLYNWFTDDNFRIGEIQFDGEAAQSAVDFVNAKLGG